jgi:hypothetical protein
MEATSSVRIISKTVGQGQRPQWSHRVRFHALSVRSVSLRWLLVSCVNALSWAKDGDLLLSGGDDTTYVSMQSSHIIQSDRMIGCECGGLTLATPRRRTRSSANQSSTPVIEPTSSMLKCYRSPLECASIPITELLESLFRVRASERPSLVTSKSVSST